MPDPIVEIVSATRLPRKDFWEVSALGLSLLRIAFDTRFIPRISFSNQRGLPDIFNERIQAPESREILIFVHDDVWIDDYFVIDRVIQGCSAFDVIGVTGSRLSVANQAAWLSADGSPAMQDGDHLAGSLARGERPFGPVSHFGPVPAECELLDGVFLAARKSTLSARAVLFDPVFDFHFYDLDFCRTARQRGLRLGVWPICLTHQSAGGVNAPDWSGKRAAYLSKWPG